MRLRIGLVAGFAAGVYAATVAQQRSRQLNQQLNQRLRQTSGRPLTEVAAEKAKAAVGSGVGRARDALAKRVGDRGVVRPVIQASSRVANQQGNGVRPT